MKETLFEEMIKAIEERNIKELEYAIAKREAEVL